MTDKETPDRNEEKGKGFEVEELKDELEGVAGGGEPGCECCSPPDQDAP